MVISRNEQDPDQVLTASFLDIAYERFDELRDCRGHPDGAVRRDVRFCLVTL